jgi:hypothetical protein
VTPERIVEVYNLSPNNNNDNDNDNDNDNNNEVRNDNNNLTSQAIFTTVGQLMSPRDLLSFQSDFGIAAQNVSFVVGGHVRDDACKISLNDCVEANLDVQYIISTAPAVPTTSYYTDGE